MEEILRLTWEYDDIALGGQGLAPRSRTFDRQKDRGPKEKDRSSDTKLSKEPEDRLYLQVEWVRENLHGKL